MCGKYREGGGGREKGRRREKGRELEEGKGEGEGEGKGEEGAIFGEHAIECGEVVYHFGKFTSPARYLCKYILVFACVLA